MKESRDHFHATHYAAQRRSGPIRHLNPTERHISLEKQIDAQIRRADSHPHGEDPVAVHVWRARDNRKGRHAVAIDPARHADEATSTPTPTNTRRQITRGLWKMVVGYPVWDVSYDVAIIFTLGSVIWVINSFFVLLPVVRPSSAFEGESTWAGGISAFVGATVFEIGSVLLMLEAVNENRTDCFGWALEESADGLFKLRQHHHCRHHHAQRHNFVSGSSLHDHVKDEASSGPDWARRMWSWWPSWYELRTHYIREIGFLACSAQMIGATIFWIAGFTALPPLTKGWSTAAENGAYWLPQVVGGTGFIVSGLLFMIEVQPRWYIPAPGVLGWHIGFWNLIGAIGFTLCGGIGFGGSREAIQWASTLSTFIGSWAFLIGSVIQWYESLDKYPVWVNTENRKLDESPRGSTKGPAAV